jgi:hypothetical protein
MIVNIYDSYEFGVESVIGVARKLACISAGDRIMIGLPSLRALDGSPGPRIWLAAEATDMRCGFDRLPVFVGNGTRLIYRV